MFNEVGAKELAIIAYNSGKVIESNPFREETEEFREFNVAWKKEHKRHVETAVKNYRSARRCKPN